MRRTVVILIIAGLASLVLYRWRSKHGQPEKADNTSNIVSPTVENTSDSKPADEGKSEPKTPPVPLAASAPFVTAQEQPKAVGTPPPAKPLQMRVEKSPAPVVPAP